MYSDFLFQSSTNCVSVMSVLNTISHYNIILPADPVKRNHCKPLCKSQAFPLSECGPPPFNPTPLCSFLQGWVRLVAVRHFRTADTEVCVTSSGIAVLETVLDSIETEGTNFFTKDSSSLSVVDLASPEMKTDMLLYRFWLVVGKIYWAREVFNWNRLNVKSQQNILAIAQRTDTILNSVIDSTQVISLLFFSSTKTHRTM